ncbi:MAG TPA: methionyl-tRNA formyltransferase [Gammaproteobacteria bacterium]|nr:methionyl-tRNA formyltransferase [Gammaproteobacteria bacterium]
MRLIFAGTSEFALPSLEALAGRHNLARVVTQPDRPAGRGRKLRATPVREKAEALGLSVSTPVRLDPDAVAELSALQPDAIVVVAYGRLVPETFLKAAAHGGINVHPSLLPRWRGAAPVERAMEAGDSETGVAIMKMDAGLDTGPVYRMETTGIRPDESAGELSDRLARRGAELLMDVLDDLEAGHAQARPQHGEASYAARLTRDEARLDFKRPAEELARRVMAFNPRPGAWADCAGERIRILRATALTGASSMPAGQVISANKQGIDVACGQGVLRILELQRPGKRPAAASEQARGREWTGLCFE